MDNNLSPEQRMRLIVMSVGAVNALLGAAITLIYLGFLPLNISYLDIPNWVVGIIGASWFLTGVSVVAFAAPHVKE
ncbi:MAG TPA: hypothetical protein VFQ23_04420 [Anaerolineales bacterium]|nr:hypothetical protein [Anaerolineales bacterium]